jgi:hypothetical protein
MTALSTVQKRFFSAAFRGDLEAEIKAAKSWSATTLIEMAQAVNEHHVEIAYRLGAEDALKAGVDAIQVELADRSKDADEQIVGVEI